MPRRNNDSELSKPVPPASAHISVHQPNGAQGTADKTQMNEGEKGSVFKRST